MSALNHKRLVYEQVYVGLTNVQRSYEKISQHLIRFVDAAIPKTPEEVSLLDSASRNIKLASDNITRVEDVKFICGLAILTEGAMVTSEEISFIIESLNDLIVNSDNEKEVGDEAIVEWASMKKSCFQEVQRILFELLNYKLNRQVHFKKTELQ
jgi:hypothetical protein